MCRIRRISPALSLHDIITTNKNDGIIAFEA